MEEEIDYLFDQKELLEDILADKMEAIKVSLEGFVSNICSKSSRAQEGYSSHFVDHSSVLENGLLLALKMDINLKLA